MEKLLSYPKTKENIEFLKSKNFKEIPCIEEDRFKYNKFLVVDVFERTFRESSIDIEGFKYVWFNPVKGEFSNTWRDGEIFNLFTSDMLNEDWLNKAREEGIYLIKYKSLNGGNVEFYNKMRLR